MLSGYEPFLIWIVIYSYALSAFLHLTGFVFSKERLLKIAGLLLIPGFVSHSAFFAIRWLRTGYFPANGNLENAITGGWFAIALTLYLFLKGRMKPVGVALFTVPATLLLTGYGVMSEPGPLPLSASFKSNWLIVHVAFAQLAFGAYAISSGFGILYLLKERRQRRGFMNRFYERFPSLEIIEEQLFRFIIYGFISELIMIAAGAIWAKDLWGRYWSWDPVEVWSLISWLLYGFSIHLRITQGWKGRRLAWLAIFLLSTVIITYWGVGVIITNTQHIFGVSD